MSDYHGYPQHEDAHPEMPWWRWGTWTDRKGDAREQLVRVDGHEADNAAEAAHIDATHPLPAPPPKCGQVWVFTYVDDDEPEIVEEWEKTVATVKRTCGIAERVWFTDSYGPVGASLTLAEWRHGEEASGGVPNGRDPALAAVPGAWPPAGAVLVAGPGAPWGPA